MASKFQVICNVDPFQVDAHPLTAVGVDVVPGGGRGGGVGSLPADVVASGSPSSAERFAPAKPTSPDLSTITTSALLLANVFPMLAAVKRGSFLSIKTVGFLEASLLPSGVAFILPPYYFGPIAIQFT